MTRTLLLALLVALHGAGAAHAAPAPQVSVLEVNGVYTVRAQFAVSAAPARVLAVLRDYERIPDFMPGVKRSVIKERAAGKTLVEQEAASKVFLFSKTVHLLLEVVETPETLLFTDVCGKSFRSYAGAWHVAPDGDGATVYYQLSARPAFDVPGFVLSRVLKNDSAAMIEGLRQAVAAR